MNSVNLERIPHLPGVYIIKDKFDKIIYIGKAKDLRKRVSSYFSSQADLSFKTANIKLLAFKIDFIITDSEREALIIERRLISEFKPFFNVLWKDSKTYPYIVITDEDYPRILITRNKKIKGKYFGPYPKVEIIKNLVEKLKDLKIINLRRCNWNFSKDKPLDEKKRERCIYYHTFQCPSPCDNKRITYKEYIKLVRNVKYFLKGKYQRLVGYFKEQMTIFSEKLDFEKAKIARDAIRAIEHISERVSINETNLNEIEKKADFTKVLIGLKEKLQLKNIPYHIESFDISNLFNKYACGGMVCFINGKKNTEHYRRYRIKMMVKKGSDDYAMIYEVVKRRIKELKEKNEKVDLFLIDGGKGQLNAAYKAIKEESFNVDLISIAKKNEEIYTSKKKFVFEKDLEELLFIEKIRDETHRFAVSYHRKLRTKDFLI